jgi:hypothetical protein
MVNGISIDEFRYYNKKFGFIEESEFDNIINNLSNEMNEYLSNTKYDEEKFICENYPMYCYTNQIFFDNKLFFHFFIEYEYNNKTKKDIINIKINLLQIPKTYSLNINDIKEIKTIKNNLLFKEKLTNNNIEFIQDFISEINWHNYCFNDNVRNIPLLTFDYIVNYSIENNIIKHYHKSYYDFIKYYSKLFNVKIIKTPNEYNSYEFEDKTSEFYFENLQYEFIGNQRYIYHIFYIHKVIEKRINNQNFRFAIFADFENYHPLYQLKIFNDTNKYYNYIEEGRIIIEDENRINYEKTLYFIDKQCNEYSTLNNSSKPKLIINPKLLLLIRNDINTLINKNTYLISPKIYDFYRNKVILYDNKTNQLSLRDKQIIEQYKKILMLGKDIKFNNVIMSKNEIKYSNDFILKFDDNFFDFDNDFLIIKNLFNNTNNPEYSYNELFNDLLKQSKIKILNRSNIKTTIYKNFDKLSFTINNINILLSRDGDRHYINNIFVRIDDIYKILIKSICFNTQEEYNNYLKDISYIGLEYKNMISNGVLIRLESNLLSSFKQYTNLLNPNQIIENNNETTLNINNYEAVLRFSLFWDTDNRSKIYININEKNYLIKHKQKFKNYFNKPSLHITFDELKKYLMDTIQDINLDILSDIIDNAIEEAKLVKKRGEDLVSNIIKDIGAVFTIETIGNKQYKGYKFLGLKSHKKYFVEINNLTVYKEDNGYWNHRCVVDKHDKERIYEDRLANRLTNIYNEPNYISTL